MLVMTWQVSPFHFISKCNKSNVFVYCMSSKVVMESVCPSFSKNILIQEWRNPKFMMGIRFHHKQVYDVCISTVGTWLPQHMTKNNECIWHIFQNDRRKTVIVFYKISSNVGISIGSYHSIFHGDLNMHHVCQYFVTKFL